MFCRISRGEIFHVANVSIIIETCKFFRLFFQKKAKFLMFLINLASFCGHFLFFPAIYAFIFATLPTPYYI